MTLENFRAVNLKIDRANGSFLSDQFAKAGDYNGRRLVVQLSNAGVVGDLTGVDVNLGWQHDTLKNTGLDPFEPVDLAQGIFEIYYPKEMLTNGNVTALIQIIENDHITETKNFKIKVEKSVIDEDTIVSENSFTVLQDALLTVNRYDSRITNVENSKVDKSTFEQSTNNLTAQLQQTEQDVTEQIDQANNLISGNYTRIETAKSELNTRIDTIIATPTTVSEQEIIDARQGETSLGANLTKIKQNEYKYKRNITSEDNLENIMESGIYFAFSTSPVGTPSDIMNQPYVLRVDFFNEAYCLQTIYSYLDSSIIYTRYVYVWATPKATPFTKVGGGYQKIIGSEINLNVDKLGDGLYWVLVGSQPLNAPSQLSSVSYMIKQEVYREQNYAIQTAYDIKKPEKMYKRWVYYYAEETTPWSVVGDDVSVKPLTGKKLLTLGDSITFGAMSTNHYQDKIADITGAEIINAGYSGAKYALITGHEPWNEFSFYQRSLDYDLTDIEYVFVMYGTNDFGNHVPIGTMDSDEYTVKGALFKGLTNLFTKKPNLKIFFSTPIFRATYDGTDTVDLDTKTNDLGLTIHEYSQAVIEVCEKFRIPVFDAQKECGINQLNQSVYLSDKLHPNNAGNDLIGLQFANFINQYV